ncbi:unnamed protein product [Moneuplotes crassus]|uniref:Cyclic nucleotide-binding domain-containing protein n=1 Tax=Euplotes crassus TaxID=5936 RepID=A0AAD1XGD1_EUPCR|nr:unnamed protein product [Moneuplotes crassus]
MSVQHLKDHEYLENKVNNILEPMMVQLVSVKPDNPTEYMINWIKQNYGNRKSINQGKRFELELLRKQIALFDGEEDKDSDSSSESNSDSDSSDADDTIAKARAARTKKGWKPRASVSAEVYGNWNKKEDFEPRCIPKDEETVEVIKDKILHNFMFKHLNNSDLQVIIDAMKVVKVKCGEMVITQGEDGNDMYLVSTGKYTCFKTFPGDSTPTHLRYYVSGEAFGELCLLYNCPRAASIQSLEEGTLIALDRATFNHIIKDAALKRREKYEEFLTSVSILQGMEPYERVALADGIVDENFSSGDYIIRQGEKGDKFYFVIDGEAVATKCYEPGQAPVEVMHYSAGSYFGELALLNDAPRAANIISRTETYVISLDKETFTRIIGSAEELLARAKQYK